MCRLSPRQPGYVMTVCDETDDKKVSRHVAVVRGNDGRSIFLGTCEAERENGRRRAESPYQWKRETSNGGEGDDEVRSSRNRTLIGHGGSFERPPSRPFLAPRRLLHLEKCGPSISLDGYAEETACSQLGRRRGCVRRLASKKRGAAERCDSWRQCYAKRGKVFRNGRALREVQMHGRAAR